jgi:hypothetical protein
MLRLQSRASRQNFINNTTSCAKNITIAQPRTAPTNLNRSKAFRDKGPNDAKIVGTFVKNANSVQNIYFMSGGYGAPNSNNRKQDTLGNRDQPQLSNINSSLMSVTAKQGMMFKNGYMYKSQAKLEANTGSMDRLGRLKAQAVSKSRSHRYD